MARTRKIQKWSYFERVLPNAVVAVKGEIACIDTATGQLMPVSTATTLVPIGYFEQDLTGDGVKYGRVQLFEEITIHEFNNDSVGTDGVEDADIMALCYLKDGSTVTEVATGRSVAGRVWGATATKVLVEVGATSDLVDNV